MCCFSIDATNDEHLGRYVNDAPKKEANCVAKPVMMLGEPHVILFALRDIKSGCELRYDYGGGDLPWRKVFCVLRYYPFCMVFH